MRRSQNQCICLKKIDSVLCRFIYFIFFLLFYHFMTLCFSWTNVTINHISYCLILIMSMLLVFKKRTFDSILSKFLCYFFLQKSILSNLIQDIEPLDLNLIQKDVPVATVDAMKRTISGMLGLLPSKQFHVSVEAFRDPLFKLLVNSMMTGYVYIAFFFC